MAFKTLDFKCALVTCPTGGSGGIGRAIADYFLYNGEKVIICDRNESHLQTASKEMRGCPYYVPDTSNINAIPRFIGRITKEHPHLDCLVNNAGVQRPLDLNEMSAVDFLENADVEIATNVMGPMHLAVGLLPHFKLKSGAVIVNVPSILGYIVMSIINPVCNGTKAFVHFWSMNLRTQLEQSGSNIRVIEMAPPTVATDLDREHKDPDDNKKNKNSIGLSVDEFMEEVTRNWQAEKDVFGAGLSQKVVYRFEFALA